MDTADSFAKYVNKLTSSGELTEEFKRQSVANFDIQYYIRVIEKLTEFIQPFHKMHAEGLFADIQIPQHNGNIFYHRSINSMNMDVVNVEYKHLYASRFTKAFIHEGYRTIPFLEKIYPLAYEMVVVPRNRVLLTEDSMWLLRFVLNGYYGVHTKLKTRVEGDVSPIFQLFEAFSDLKSKPIVHIYVDMICFDSNKLEHPLVDDVAERLSCIDELLHIPQKDIFINTKINQNLYRRSKILQKHYN